jgi:murein DD-endopeptidase MepM/ murein hydrolase activator NlpD
VSAIAAAPVDRGPLHPDEGVLFGWLITSYFGNRINPLTGRPGNHGGMDLAYYGCGGAAIRATVSGTLSQGWDSSGGGNWSSLTGDNGDYWGFGHASHFAWPYGGTRRVSAGQIIAFVGTTGGSTGNHLHIAYRPKGATRYEDPFDTLTEFGEPGLTGTHVTGDEIDMADIEQLRTEFVNQDTRTRMYIDSAFANKDARDKMFMTALVLKATRAIGGEEAFDKLKAELSRKR